MNTKIIFMATIELFVLKLKWSNIEQPAKPGTI